MTAKEAADTPALLKVFSPGLDLVKEPKTMNGHTPRQLPVVEDVRNDQRLDDRQSPVRDCPNCGAKGDKTHDKDTCPARNKGCFNCGVWGHYGRMCREPRRQLAAGMHVPDRHQKKKALAQDRCPWCGARTHPRDVCPAQVASTGCQSGRKGQEALSTNIWPSLESRVWRPREVSADVHLKSRRGHVELDGRWDMDPSRGIQLDLQQSEADFFDKLSCPYCGVAQEEFENKEQLQTHLKERHYNEYRCHHCREEFVVYYWTIYHYRLVNYNFEEILSGFGLF
jgi:hypothetical protein